MYRSENNVIKIFRMFKRDDNVLKSFNILAISWSILIILMS